MTCPYLEYRRSDGDGLKFDHERAFCSIQGEFVSPIIADVCNDRGRFHHTTHCEVHRQHVSGSESERSKTQAENVR